MQDRLLLGSYHGCYLSQFQGHSSVAFLRTLDFCTSQYLTRWWLSVMLCGGSSNKEVKGYSMSGTLLQEMFWLWLRVQQLWTGHCPSADLTVQHSNMNFKNSLQKLPNHVVDKSYSLREFDMSKRVFCFFYKPAHLSLVGMVTGTARAVYPVLCLQREIRSMLWLTFFSLASESIYIRPSMSFCGWQW